VGGGRGGWVGRYKVGGARLGGTHLQCNPPLVLHPAHVPMMFSHIFNHMPIISLRLVAYNTPVT
jgi:hypothetical protein